MHIAMKSIPAKIDAPGAVARQLPEFGNANGCGQMAAEWFSLAAGTDIQPLLKASRMTPATHRTGVS